MHTHVSENVGEIQWVRSLFPERAGYLDVYDHYGLLGPRSVLAHGVHLTARRARPRSRDRVGVAHCPTSNLFLGSGLFHVHDAKDPKRPMHVGLGTDVGAGTSFSILATMNEAYKVAELNTYPMNSIKSFYLATLGGARALHLGDSIGSLEVGKEADFVVLDPEGDTADGLPQRACGVDGGAHVRPVDHGRRPGGEDHLRGRPPGLRAGGPLMSSTGHAGYAHATTRCSATPSARG